MATEPVKNSFEGLTEEEMATHTRIRKYGSFYLTGAVAPSYDLKVVPETGFRYKKYEDPRYGNVSCIMVSASAEILLDLFLDLIDLVGKTVDVVLESSHNSPPANHRDFYCDKKDLCVVKSFAYQFEKILLEDGCTGIAVLNAEQPFEVQFNEHKLIVVYSETPEKLKEAERVILRHGISKKSGMKFITHAEHIHVTMNWFELEFERLQGQLGADLEEE